MMKLCFWERWSVFVGAGVSPQIIFLTLGELGISQDSVLQPKEMAAIRRREAEAAMRFLGASWQILSLPDLQLSFIPLETLVRTVLPLIRQHGSDAIFSFHPYETTWSFDHPDHNVAGVVAKHVGAAADVKHFMPESPALAKRPELYLWKSTPGEQVQPVALQPGFRQRRIDYLLQHYPSQFSEASKEQWIPIFDSLTEGYVRVR